MVALHVFVCLLVFFLILFLVRLWCFAVRSSSTQEVGPSTPQPNVCLSHAPHLTAPTAASPVPTYQ